MVNEILCNELAVTDLLLRDHSIIADSIIANCTSKGIWIQIIKGASDYWCRDFMPVQVNRAKFVQFVFDPPYYKHKCYQHLKTDISQLTNYPDQNVVRNPIVLDGGNLTFYDNKVIITDRVFKDNPTHQRTDLLDNLMELLEADEFRIIPALPYDITGHADGMVKLISRDTVLLNDFRLITGKSYWNRLLKALCGFNIILLPNDLHLNQNTDDATGDYMNMIGIQDLAFVPIYRRSTYELAINIIELALTNVQIVPIKCNILTTKGGGLHCATWTSFQQH